MKSNHCKSLAQVLAATVSEVEDDLVTDGSSDSDSDSEVSLQSGDEASQVVPSVVDRCHKFALYTK